MSKHARSLDRKLIGLRSSRQRMPSRVVVRFDSAEEKACYLDGAAREEASLPEIRALAKVVVSLPYEERAETLYDFVRRSVDYLLDPDGEEFEDAATTLIAGQDDCDGSAKALVALAIAAGLEGCIRAVVTPDGRRVAHFQAMLRWPGSSQRSDALSGGWILADTTLEGVRLGEGAEAGVGRDDGGMITLREVAPGQYGPALEMQHRRTLGP